METGWIGESISTKWITAEADKGRNKSDIKMEIVTSLFFIIITSKPTIMFL